MGEKNEKLGHGVWLGAEMRAVTCIARLAHSHVCFVIVLIQVTAEKKGSHLFFKILTYSGLSVGVVMKRFLRSE